MFDNVTEEVAEHFRIKPLLSSQRRSSFALFDNQRIYADTSEIALDDFKDAVAGGLFIL